MGGLGGLNRISLFLLVSRHFQGFFPRLIVIFTDFHRVQHTYHDSIYGSKILPVVSFNLFNVLTWVRYFPILSLLALGTASMATGLLYRDRALADLVTRGEHENIALAQTLTNSLGTQLQPILQTSETGPQANLKREVHVQLLHQSILDQMQALPITRVKILDRQGTVLFSTDPAHLGQDRRHRQDVLAAQQGQVVTALDDPKTLADFPQTTAQRRMLSSAIPLRLSGQVLID